MESRWRKYRSDEGLGSEKKSKNREKGFILSLGLNLIPSRTSLPAAVFSPVDSAIRVLILSLLPLGNRSI
ncbi:hypothetical protein L2E82_13949 [Cichorium intybus]|uniref:Uncharacterized protein n=1 Tax=Cichorium intybus TaxID=13427 RepID=A0ACB9EYY6_CICIN|nr:hypothetical protein L2E82_13949 [Cichorium intybus]